MAEIRELWLVRSCTDVISPWRKPLLQVSVRYRRSRLQTRLAERVAYNSKAKASSCLFFFFAFLFFAVKAGLAGEVGERRAGWGKGEWVRGGGEQLLSSVLAKICQPANIQAAPAARQVARNIVPQIASCYISRMLFSEWPTRPLCDLKWPLRTNLRRGDVPDCRPYEWLIIGESGEHQNQQFTTCFMLDIIIF